MIQDPILLAFVLILIEIFILSAANHPRTKKFFDVIPSVFWIYFLPMMASSAGLIDPKSPLYAHATNIILPISLFILLVTANIKAILSLGSKALIMFFVGAIGIGIGTVVAFNVFKGIIGSEFWAGFGALSGSWTGGSANMIAVKEALSTPDEVFLPMVVVDTVVPYVWMGLLMICAKHQGRIDQWNKADDQVLQDIDKKLRYNATVSKGLSLPWTVIIVLIGIVGGGLAIVLAGFMPQIKNVITTFAWTIILVSTLAIICSFSKIKVIEAHGSNKIGYFLLYFVLTTIGAKANIAHIGNAMVLIGAGFVIVVIHAIILIAAMRMSKVPVFLAAVASQANIGGVASAPMVAEVYRQGFASVGLLLAILGNILGTYIGIVIGQICRFLS